jgi:uncharacterized membrane protein YfcA
MGITGSITGASIGNINQISLAMILGVFIIVIGGYLIIRNLKKATNKNKKKE